MFSATLGWTQQGQHQNILHVLPFLDVILAAGLQSSILLVKSDIFMYLFVYFFKTVEICFRENTLYATPYLYPIVSWSDLKLCTLSRSILTTSYLPVCLEDRRERALVRCVRPHVCRAVEAVSRHICVLCPAGLHGCNYYYPLPPPAHASFLALRLAGGGDSRMAHGAKRFLFVFEMEWSQRFAVLPSNNPRLGHERANRRARPVFYPQLKISKLMN